MQGKGIEDMESVTNMIMTTGTPNSSDRGAAYLTECAKAIKARVNLPIQAQCEPPDDFVWFERLQAAGVGFAQILDFQCEHSGIHV